MLLSFSQFINEGTNSPHDFVKRIVTGLIDKIRHSRGSDSLDYETFGGMEFSEPFEFDLRLHVRRDMSPDFDKDSHFNTLSWEELNFNQKGFAIDANLRINQADLLIPEVDIHIIMDPRKEPGSYDNLAMRLLDILVHETNHLDQVSRRRNPFNVKASDQQERNGAKKSSKYFLLVDEVESMVEGMWARAKAQGVPLDHIFTDYLAPFVQSKYISSDEYEKVMSVWVKHAASYYPDAQFSSKVRKIIDSI